MSLLLFWSGIGGTAAPYFFGNAKGPVGIIISNDVPVFFNGDSVQVGEFTPVNTTYNSSSVHYNSGTQVYGGGSRKSSSGPTIISFR